MARNGKTEDQRKAELQLALDNATTTTATGEVIRDYSSKSISQPDLNGLYALMLEEKKFKDLPNAGAMRLSSLSHNGMALKGGRASIELLLRMRDAGNTASEMLAALRRA